MSLAAHPSSAGTIVPAILCPPATTTCSSPSKPPAPTSPHLRLYSRASSIDLPTITRWIDTDAPLRLRHGDGQDLVHVDEGSSSGCGRPRTAFSRIGRRCTRKGLALKRYCRVFLAALQHVLGDFDRIAT